MKFESAAITNGAAKDSAQNVTAALVRRLNSVGNGARKRADVIGDNAKGSVCLDLDLGWGSTRGRAIGVNRPYRHDFSRQRAGVFLTAQFFEFVKNRSKNIRLIIRDNAGKIRKAFRALDNRGGPLETHPGVDMPLRKR